MTARLTTLQADVLDVLDAVWPSLLTTNEVAERRTGWKYDHQESYRALRQLEHRGRVVGFRLQGRTSVGWASAGDHR